LATDAVAARNWNALARKAAGCERCDLHETRNHVVYGDGDPRSDLVFIGESPGRHEDLVGRPYVGAGGNLLDNLLQENAIARSDVYVTTLVKCRPPNHRQAEPDEVETCSTHLRDQLNHIRPKVIVTLGAMPSRVILGREVPIAKVAGYRFPVRGATVIPTYGLDDVLKGSPAAMSALRRDVRTAVGVAEGRIPPAEEALTLRAGAGAP
jgi:uracil-DNA glycosylase